MNAVLVYVVCPDEETSMAIGKDCVVKKLAACANIIPEIKSFCLWGEKPVMEKESVLLLKTMASCVGELMEYIQKLHPYDCPAIMTFPIDNGYTAFLQWIEDSCKK